MTCAHSRIIWASVSRSSIPHMCITRSQKNRRWKGNELFVVMIRHDGDAVSRTKTGEGGISRGRRGLAVSYVHGDVPQCKLCSVSARARSSLFPVAQRGARARHSAHPASTAGTPSRAQRDRARVAAHQLRFLCVVSYRCAMWTSSSLPDPRSARQTRSEVPRGGVPQRASQPRPRVFPRAILSRSQLLDSPAQSTIFCNSSFSFLALFSLTSSPWTRTSHHDQILMMVVMEPSSSSEPMMEPFR